MLIEEKKAIDLIKIIRDMGGELNIRQKSLEALTLDSYFDKDLGLDSLSRVEFISRIELYFGYVCINS